MFKFNSYAPTSNLESAGNTIQTVTSENGVVSGGYVRIGRLVIVDIVYKNSVALKKSDTIMVSNLPYPAIGHYAPLLALNAYTSTAHTVFVVNNIIRPLFDLSTTENNIHITGAYITAES